MFFLIICILFTTPYNQNIHNEGQKTHYCAHWSNHRDVNRLWVIPATDSVQQVKSCLIFTCVIWVFLLLSMDSRRKGVKELVLPYNISVVGHLILSLKKVIRIHLWCRYLIKKKKKHLWACQYQEHLFIYMFYRLTHALYYRKQKNTFYIWETNYYCLEKTNYDFVVI